jgi:pimeloyl-ACP methyl ester carboxylesterase
MEWRKHHKTINLHHQNISYIDTEHGDETLLILHGFATSSYDYHKIIDELKKSYRVIIPDLIGFGFSSKPKHYFYTAKDQASLLTVFLRALEIEDLSIMAQGFGVCILDEIESIIELGNVDLNLNDIYIINSRIQLALTKDETDLELQKQSFTTSLTKMSLSLEMFKKYVKMTFYNKEEVSDEELEIYWKMLNFNNGIKTMDFIENYMLETARFGKKRLKNLKKSSINKYIIWGKNDEAYCLESFEKIKDLLEINPENNALIEDCGYFPMLEKPEEFTSIIKSFKKSA